MWIFFNLNKKVFQIKLVLIFIGPKILIFQISKNLFREILINFQGKKSMQGKIIFKEKLIKNKNNSKDKSKKTIKLRKKIIWTMMMISLNLRGKISKV
jgi:hypothetical protein